jgi:hypothetical protein
MTFSCEDVCSRGPSFPHTYSTQNTSTISTEAPFIPFKMNVHYLPLFDGNLRKVLSCKHTGMRNSCERKGDLRN